LLHSYRRPPLPQLASDHQNSLRWCHTETFLVAILFSTGIPNTEAATRVGKNQSPVLIECGKIRVPRSHLCNFFSRTNMNKARLIRAPYNREIFLGESCNLRDVVGPFGASLTLLQSFVLHAIKCFPLPPTKAVPSRENCPCCVLVQVATNCPEETSNTKSFSPFEETSNWLPAALNSNFLIVL